MRLVIDANIVIAGLMRDSTVRRLLLLGGHSLHAPAYLLDEVESHWEDLQRRSGLSSEAFREVLGILRRHFHEHEHSEYEAWFEEARAMLADDDPDDVPYFALALALGADGVWSEDRGLSTRAGVRVYRTAEILEGD